jgi:hypothetical protein
MSSGVLQVYLMLRTGADESFVQGRCSCNDSRGLTRDNKIPFLPSYVDVFFVASPGLRVAVRKGYRQ